MRDLTQPPEDWDRKYQVIQRLLTLRREMPCRLGIVLCEGGLTYISGTLGDPLGEIGRWDTKHFYRLDELEDLCDELESDPSLIWLHAPSGPYPKKPSTLETKVVKNVSRIA